MSRLGKTRGVGVCCWLAVAVNAICSPLASGFDPIARWKTGRDFQRALAGRFGVVSWPEGSGVRSQLQRLAQLQRVAIFVDRRIDPDLRVQISLRDVTLASLLERVAQECDAATTQLGDVIYIGPQSDTDALSDASHARTQEIARLPRGRAVRMQARRAWRWEALAEPAALIAELADEANVRIEGAEQIPHDLWPAANLPAMAWGDRLTLVLAGFGLTFEISSDGGSVRLRPLPEPELTAKTYTSILTQMAWDRLVEEFPRSELSRTTDGIVLEGTAGDHLRLRRLLDQLAKPSGNAQRSQVVHTLRVAQQPVGAILKTLEKQLQLRMVLADDAAEELQTRVTFDVREVSLEELLEATLAPTALTFRWDGDTLHIQRRE